MTTLFGMAGLAEAAQASALVVGYAGLLLSGLLAAVGLFTRSRVTMCGALLLIGLVTFMFLPWELFEPVDSTDPDVHHWSAEWRTFGRWWIFTTATVLVALIRVFTFTRSAAERQNPTPSLPQ